MAGTYDFLESFSDRNYSDVLKKVWNNSVAPGGHSFTTGRFSGYQSYACGAFGSLQADFGGSTTPGSSGIASKMGVGFAFYIDAANGEVGANTLFQTSGVSGSGLNVNLSLETTDDGRLILRPPFTPAVTTDVRYNIKIKTWYYLEWEVTYHEADGVIVTDHTYDSKVYLDGTLILNVTGILATAWSVFKKYFNVSIIRFNPTNVSGIRYADFYFRTAGVFGAGLRVMTLRPTGDGTFSEWGAVPEYDAVDETLLDTTDFIITSATAPKRDTFIMEDISVAPGGRNVKAQQYSAYNTGFQDDNVKLRHYLYNGAPAQHLGFAITGQYYRWYDDVDPFDATGFTVTEINATEGGVVIAT